MSASLPASAVLRSATEQLAAVGADAQAFAVLSVDELRTLLTTIATLAASAVGMLGSDSTRECPRMLTVEEFRVRYRGTPKPPTAATVERWCRDGDLPYAMFHGKAGWRIPEFHLWSKEPPPALRWAFAHLMSAKASCEEVPTGAAPATPVDTTTGEHPNGNPDDAADAAAGGAATSDAERASRLTSDGYDPDSLDDFKVILASRRMHDGAATDAAKPEATLPEACTAGRSRKEVRRSSA